MLSRRTLKGFSPVTDLRQRLGGASLPSVPPVDPEPPDEGETSAAEEWRRFGETVGYVSSGGIQMVAGAGLGFLAGSWIDGKIGSKPLFTVLLALGGLIAGVVQLFRAV